LWYFGTINLNTPASYEDGGTITIDAPMRTNWWLPVENRGTNAGFYYSRLGGGNRFSTERPAGVGTDSINQGIHSQILSGNPPSNRTTLTVAVSGTWPNIISVTHNAGPAPVIAGNVVTFTYVYQSYANGCTNIICLDDDLNPYNGTVRAIGTNIHGATAKTTPTGTLVWNTTGAPAGTSYVCARISGAAGVRYLYAPQALTIAVAPTIAGIATGVFVNPDGPSGMVVSGVGTSHFSWGTPLNQGSPPCSLSFTGTNFLTSVGLQFPIGTLTYTNSVTSGGEAESVALRVSIPFAFPVGVSNTQEFIFRLVTTPNTPSGGSADADMVRLVTPFASDLISVGEQVYGLRLSFGQVTESGFAEIDELFVLEERWATAELRAELIPAVPISVVVAGVFTNPAGPAGMAVSGVGTSHFTWGVAVGGSSSNRFDLIGTNITASTEQPITLASLSYFNGGIQFGTEATSVVMLLTLNLPNESLTTNLPFRLELVTTPNTNDARASADIVRLVNPLPAPVVRLSGVAYALKLGFGTVSTNGFSNVEEFAVEEDRTANVTIRGIFSRFIVPQPAFSVTLRRQSTSYLLTWPTSVARRYQVQTATNLLNFIPLSGEITATASTTAFVDTNASVRFKFYRVVELP